MYNYTSSQGFKHCGAYIATQGPLKETAGDLWRMLLEFNSKCIVMLCSLNEIGEVCLEGIFSNIWSIIFYVMMISITNTLSEKLTLLLSLHRLIFFSLSAGVQLLLLASGGGGH